MEKVCFLLQRNLFEQKNVTKGRSCLRSLCVVSLQSTTWCLVWGTDLRAAEGVMVVKYVHFLHDFYLNSLTKFEKFKTAISILSNFKSSLKSACDHKKAVCSSKAFPILAGVFISKTGLLFQLFWHRTEFLFLKTLSIGPAWLFSPATEERFILKILCCTISKQKSE